MVNFLHTSTVGVAQSFDSIRVSIASPEAIRGWSYGEIKKPDTVNYRTIKPENGGLFCARIFGPIKDYECLCGKYKRMKYRGVVCEKCGVEVTLSKVRRERMGHIELASPVAHIWFLRSLPSRISTLLDIMFRDVERILYFDAYVIIDPGISHFKYGQLLTERELCEAQDKFGESSFEAGTGAEAIKKMLVNLDLEVQRTELRAELVNVVSETKRKKIVKRLKLVEDFIESGNKPEWMVLEVLPVIPPELRPLVMLDGGRFATSDLNELYRRVINRNNRLHRLLELRAPDIILRNEKRMLQEAVDALFDNSRKAKSLKSPNKRPYKSLADMVRGKQGRFRQNLLGKRVDYSGRSVIVVGPELKLYQCGLPKKMALELFKPFVYAKLELYGFANTLKSAKRIVQMERPEVWDILEEITKEHPVLLNRAPTLHRLGIQAFEPVLTDGKAIKLHPLVCTAFNADFDGDQMAVHVPISIEAQLEARALMMSTNNILSLTNGKPIIVPTQDIILGLYYMSLELDGQPGEGKHFLNAAEIEHALHSEVVSLHTKIKCRRTILDLEGNKREVLVDTTPGRVLISELLPQNAHIGFDLVNKLLTKKEVASLVDSVYRRCGQQQTVFFSDRLMQLGFEEACRSGISIGKNDITIPTTKAQHVRQTTREVKQYESQYSEGLITYGERYNKVIDAWSRCGDKIAADMMNLISGEVDHSEGAGIRSKNSLYMMMHSGARGSVAQLRQLAGMRGLMTKPSGEIIEVPIISNLKEGLTVLEYFTSTHGARKGQADTALKTANSGYLTRKLVDVAQDFIITEEDCGTEDGLVVKAVIESGEIIVSLADVILGRVLATSISHPVTQELIADKGHIIDEGIAIRIEEAGIDSVKVRSALMCKAKSGMCARCYGRDMSTGGLINMGEAVGVIAAQSIGEPGTQLTMNTFHSGGVMQKASVQSTATVLHEGHVQFVHKNVVLDSEGKKILMSRNCEAVVVDTKGIERARYKIPYGARLLVEHGDPVAVAQQIAEWDPFTIPIITEKSGRISLIDLIEGASVKEVQDDITGVVNRVVIEGRSHHMRGQNDFHPRIALLDEKTGDLLTLANGLEARYSLPIGAILSVNEGDLVNAGDIISRVPRESLKSKDITGGLPRVIELFEARQPKDHSIINVLDGYVEFGKDYKSKKCVIVRSVQEEGGYIEYFVPRGRHIAVSEGDYVEKGDMLMEGTPSPHDILKIMGVGALAEYMVSEVQQVYRLQGVVINDKHIEVILSRMLKKVEIVHPGGTIFLTGNQVDRDEFDEVNAKTVKLGYEPAEATPVLQGITRASLQTKSFLSAASFQETTRVLTEAAVAGKVDRLRGLKENVIVGRLIPAGTGFFHEKFRKLASSACLGNAISVAGGAVSSTPREVVAKDSI